MATGDGGEGSPIEIDPLGGSVGMFTPYITLSGGTYTPRYPDLIQPYDVSEPTGSDFSSLYATFGSRTADLPGFGTNWGSFAELANQQIDERMHNSLFGVGFHTSEELGGRPGARLTGFMTEFGEFQDFGQAQIHTEGIGDIIPEWDDPDSAWDGDGPEQKLFTIGFTVKQAQMIADQVAFMGNNEACRKSFEAAGLTNVNSMVFGGGLTFVSKSELGDSKNNGSWNGDETLRNGMLNGYRQGLYVQGASAVGKYKGAFFSSLQDRAFSGSDKPFVEVLIHELIHVGGAAGRNDAIAQSVHFPADRVGSVMTPAADGVVHLPPSHDLEWMNYDKDGKYIGLYDKIQQSCTPR